MAERAAASDRRPLPTGLAGWRKQALDASSTSSIPLSNLHCLLAEPARLFVNYIPFVTGSLSHAWWDGKKKRENRKQNGKKKKRKGKEKEEIRVLAACCVRFLPRRGQETRRFVSAGALEGCTCRPRTLEGARHVGAPEGVVWKLGSSCQDQAWFRVRGMAHGRPNRRARGAFPGRHRAFQTFQGCAPRLPDPQLPPCAERGSDWAGLVAEIGMHRVRIGAAHRQQHIFSTQ